MAVKKSRNRSGFIIYSHFKESEFIEVKEWKVLILECERCHVSLDGILWYTKYLLVQK